MGREASHRKETFKGRKKGRDLSAPASERERKTLDLFEKKKVALNTAT